MMSDRREHIPAEAEARAMLANATPEQLERLVWDILCWDAEADKEEVKRYDA